MPTAALTKELEYIAKIREDKLRPAKFRTIFGDLVTSDGAPAWIENITIHKVRGYASLKPTQHKGGDLPQPDFEKLATSFPAVEYGCAFTIYDREMDRAGATGINVSAQRATLNDTASEKFLDSVAAKGHALTGLPGLLNNAAVATTTAVTKTGGGTTWTGAATMSEILQDCHALINDLVNATKENTEEGSVDLILPFVQRQVLFTKRNGATDMTIEAMLRRDNPYLNRILVWNHAATLGAGATPRACAVDLKREEVARMIILQELTDDAPRRVSRGYVVDQTLVTAGVIAEDITGIRYMDGL